MFLKIVHIAESVHVQEMKGENTSVTGDEYAITERGTSKFPVVQRPLTVPKKR